MMMYVYTFTNLTRIIKKTFRTITSLIHSIKDTVCA